MHARQEQQLRRLQRIHSMLSTAPRAQFPPIYQRTLDDLGATISRISLRGGEQLFARPVKVGKTSSVRALSQKLRRLYMIPLARVARPLLRFAPGVEGSLVVPHARARLPEIVAAAVKMGRALRPHRKLLVEAGLESDMLTEMKDMARELHRLSTTTSERQLRHGVAARAAREELARATVMAKILDGLIIAQMTRDPKLRTFWRRVSRTPKPSGRPPKRKRRNRPAEDAA